MDRWIVSKVQCQYFEKSARLDRLLSLGWEPFSASGFIKNGKFYSVIFLRIKFTDLQEALNSNK